MIRKRIEALLDAFAEWVIFGRMTKIVEAEAQVTADMVATDLRSRRLRFFAGMEERRARIQEGHATAVSFVANDLREEGLQAMRVITKPSPIDEGVLTLAVEGCILTDPAAPFLKFTQVERLSNAIAEHAANLTRERLPDAIFEAASIWAFDNSFEIDADKLTAVICDFIQIEGRKK